MPDTPTPRRLAATVDRMLFAVLFVTGFAAIGAADADHLPATAVLGGIAVLSAVALYAIDRAPNR